MLTTRTLNAYYTNLYSFLQEHLMLIQEERRDEIVKGLELDNDEAVGRKDDL